MQRWERVIDTIAVRRCSQTKQPTERRRERVENKNRDSSLDQLKSIRTDIKKRKFNTIEYMGHQDLSAGILIGGIKLLCY